MVGIGRRRSAYILLVERPDRKRPLGRPTLNWENNIKINLQAVGWGGMDSVDMVQDRDMWRAVEDATMNFRIP
jgi:hypothetical protein